MSALSPADMLPAPETGLAAPPLTSHLSRRRKAAVIVRFMLAQGVSLPLSALPQELQEALTLELAGMRSIDKPTLDTVIDEFSAELGSHGLSFPSGLPTALEILEGSISESIAKKIRHDAGLDRNNDPWKRLVALDVAQLLPALDNESVEVAAVLLSKLSVSKAAELLGLLPGERARRITYAVSRTGSVRPEVVRLIGQSLIDRLGSDEPSAFDDGPVDRVGAILNFAPSATREQVLEGLDETDGEFAEQVRKAIFTFANIPSRIDARDLPKIVRDVDQQDLVKAIAAAKGADESAAEFILANMSQRMAETLREEARDVGTVTIAEADAAMNAVVAAIRQLESNGEIFLIADEG